MAFFQPNVLKKYVNGLKQELLTEKYELYKAYFFNPEIQENIRKSKEEQFQEGFLRELFVKILGYTLNPSPNFNLITEQKNEADSKKADGAIIVDDKIVGVIELKDHKTTDLKSVEAQAFGYKSQNQNAKYVVISNFEKLNFYIDNSVAFQEFDLFHLSLADFATLWICLAFESIKTNLPETVKKESVSNEDSITKSFYRDYSGFKKALFADILQNNRFDTPDEKILIFKKTQKLLDRMLFIFFAEDGGLLQPNTMRMIIDRWEKLRDMDAYTPLYEQIRKYFGYIDTGHEDKQLKVFAYNGGLFKPDDLLDRLIISDDLLAMHTRRLADYDFRSDVDVNILGHIFEHSLSEIEEVTNQLQEGGKVQQTSKRKKDGVFYTPQYITKYIVENTIGKLCAEKKAELGIRDDEYFADRKRQESTKRCLLEKLYAYRDWLKQITICDPACGSGAFLNASLNFLIAEHSLINEMETKIAGGGMVFSYFGNDILERNIYGVDINEESVEIAKLSLWLRTAQPNRKLNSLNNNIKCGNSLISDPEVAGDKAFDWEKEFPEVFVKGGFDVVIGNPPYVRAELLSSKDIEFYKNNYKAFTPDGDLFSYFYEKGMSIVKQHGKFAFISNTFDKTTAGKSLRKLITDNYHIEQYIDFTEVQIFEGATTYPIILVLNKNGKSDVFVYRKIPHELQGNVINIDSIPVKQVAQNNLDPESWGFSSIEMNKIIQKITEYPQISKLFSKCYYGVKTAFNEGFFIDGEMRQSIIDKDSNANNIIKPVYEGKDLSKWTNNPLDKYLLCTHNGYKNVDAVDINSYPSVKEHLDQYYPQLEKRYDKGRTPYNLRNCAYQDLFYSPKIIWGNLQNSNKFSLDESGSIISAPACMLPTNNKALLCVLNSKLVWTFLTNICVVRNGGYIEVKPQYFEQIPVPETIKDDENEIKVCLDALANTMLDLNKTLQQKRFNFLTAIKAEFSFEKTTQILEKIDEYDFKTFLAELKKVKAIVSASQKIEWAEAFTTYKQECNDLSQKITATDSEIDQKVYELYGLTDEEIAIVEGKD
mgnify:CR=1 FL=1